ncbi:MAG TPA: sugar transferase [Bacteroidales bacterium]|nr:sugar transferase [Bacteroidales bacterium]
MASTIPHLYFEIQAISTYIYTKKATTNEPQHTFNPRDTKFLTEGEFTINLQKMVHPFSKYLQDYVYKQNELQEGGKFKDDFRVTTLGKIFRKLWLDELPMIMNLLKGEIKLVGVRPLSRHYYSLYTDELQQKRIQYKPGLIPPFYADMPETLEEIMASEMKYLEAYEKSPFKTDWKYFWKVFNSIVFKRARSA